MGQIMIRPEYGVHEPDHMWRPAIIVFSTCDIVAHCAQHANLNHDFYALTGLIK